VADFWATVCKTVRPMLSDCCPDCLSSVCNVGVLWPDGWIDQDETRHGGKPRSWPYCTRWGSSYPSPKGAQLSIFSPWLLWLNSRPSQSLLSTWQTFWRNCSRLTILSWFLKNSCNALADNFIVARAL